MLTEWTAFLAIDEGYRAAEEPVTVHQPASIPAGVTPPPPPRAPVARHARMSAPSVPRPAMLLDGLGSGEGLRGRGAGGGGYAREPNVAAAAPTERRMEPERGDAAGDAARRCYEQARRADGSIDQAALADCLRRARGPMKQASEAPKTLAPPSRVVAVDRRRR